MPFLFSLLLFSSLAHAELPLDNLWTSGIRGNFTGKIQGTGSICHVKVERYWNGKSTLISMDDKDPKALFPDAKAGHVDKYHDPLVSKEFTFLRQTETIYETKIFTYSQRILAFGNGINVKDSENQITLWDIEFTNESPPRLISIATENRFLKTNRKVCEVNPRPPARKATAKPSSPSKAPAAAGATN